MKSKIIITTIAVIALAITLTTPPLVQIVVARHGHRESGGGSSSDNPVQSTNDNTNDNSQSTSDNTNGNSKLLCYAAGGLLLLGGVPAPEVYAAGNAAHNAGICP